MKKHSVWLCALLAAVLVVGCANQKQPAQQAIAAAQASLDGVRTEAQKYVPDQLQAVDTQMQALKDNFAKGDYKSVITGAPTLTSAIVALKDAADAKKADLEAAAAKAKEAWASMSTDLPKLLDAIQKKADTLSKTHHLPKGLTKEGLESAKATMTQLKSNWGDASNAAGSGDFPGAMAKAQEIHDKAAEIAKSLGVPTG